MKGTGDIVERLRDWLHMTPVACIEAAEIERLHAALLTCPCPGGGYTGMPEDTEATVGALLREKICDDRIMQLWDRGYDTVDIARELGVYERDIAGRLSKLRFDRTTLSSG